MSTEPTPNPAPDETDPWLDEYSRPGMGEGITSVEKRRPGRPKGKLGAVLTDLTDRVTLEDFSFVWALCWRRSNIDHLCRLNFDQGLLSAV